MSNLPDLSKVSETFLQSPDNTVGRLTKREYCAIQLLQGFISSGRKSAVIEKEEVSLEEAAKYHTDKLFELLKNED